MAEAPVLYRVRSGAARIVLNRPERRNALSAGLVNELSRAVQRAFADDEVRCLVISGAGEGFCAGADLKDPPGRDVDGGDVPFADVLQALWEGPKPVVVLVHGAAFGGGLGLVAAGDIVLAADDASFSFSEVRIGVIPAIISVLCLRKLGRHHGMRLFLTGDRFDGRHAVDVGLVHRAVPPLDLEAEGEREIAALRLGAPGALAECRRLVREIPHLGLEEGFRVATEWSGRLFAGEEAREGMTAFREKRSPSWALDGVEPEEGS